MFNGFANIIILDNYTVNNAPTLPPSLQGCPDPRWPLTLSRVPAQLNADSAQSRRTPAITSWIWESSNPPRQTVSLTQCLLSVFSLTGVLYHIYLIASHNNELYALVPLLYTELYAHTKAGTSIPAAGGF